MAALKNSEEELTKLRRSAALLQTRVTAEETKKAGGGDTKRSREYDDDDSSSLGDDVASGVAGRCAQNPTSRKHAQMGQSICRTHLRAGSEVTLGVYA